MKTLKTPWNFSHDYDDFRMLMCLSSLKHDLDGRISYRQAVRNAIETFHPRHKELIEAITRAKRLCKIAKCLHDS